MKSVLNARWRGIRRDINVGGVLNGIAPQRGGAPVFRSDAFVFSSGSGAREEACRKVRSDSERDQARIAWGVVGWCRNGHVCVDGGPLLGKNLRPQSARNSLLRRGGRGIRNRLRGKSSTFPAQHLVKSRISRFSRLVGSSVGKRLVGGQQKKRGSRLKAPRIRSCRGVW